MPSFFSWQVETVLFFLAEKEKNGFKKAFLWVRRKPEKAGGQYPQGVCRIRKAPSSLTAAQSRPPLRVQWEIRGCNDALQLLPDPHPSASQTPSPEGKAIRCGGEGAAEDRRNGRTPRQGDAKELEVWEMDRIVCVVGPTASGKTALAVRLAKALDGEVVSCDSMQIYRRMDIGTAKPTAEEMDGVRHHMIDVADPTEDFSVGRYVELADAAVQDILARGRVCVIAGGTGLYVDSLIAGRTFAPVPATGKRAALEAQMRAEGGETLLRELRAIDPETAARLHPADEKRIIRALEVWQETGRTITEHNLETQKLPPRYAPVWIGLDFENRSDLYARIDRRVERMLEQGLLDEIRALLASGVPETATSLQAIGYKEFFSYLRGAASLEEATALCQQRSRNYAKRQLTWFRRNAAMHWIFQPAQPDGDAVFAAARQQIPFFAEEI